MSEYTKGTLVSKVLNILEKDYDVAGLEDVGMIAAAEIEERLPLIAAAPEMHKFLTSEAELGNKIAINLLKTLDI